MEHELLNAGLSKNVNSVIIGYLTEPPILPFLLELCDMTRDIQQFSNIDWYYSKYFHYFYENNKRDKVSRVVKIRRKGNYWFLRYYDHN